MPGRDAAGARDGDPQSDAARVPDDAAAPVPNDDAASADASELDASALDASPGPSCGAVSCAAPSACFGLACLTLLADPGPPVLPAQIDTLTIITRTATAIDAGTDQRTQLCLTATRCFTLDLQDDLDEHTPGVIDVYQSSGVRLPRSAVDRVGLRVLNPTGNDPWAPSCVAVLFDGELAYCENVEPLRLATTTTDGIWVDPAGVHLGCGSCYPQTLTHGPMLGGLEPDRVRVLVRTDATRAVSLRLSGSATVSSAADVAWAHPSPARDFTSVLEVGGLEPGRTYYYSVAVDGVVSTPARAITMPPAIGQPGVLDVAFGSCTGRGVSQTIFDHLLGLDPQLFLFLGDNTYADTTYLSVLRDYYRRALAERPRAEFVANVPVLAIWDDHDFIGNDSWGRPVLRDVARRAFVDYWPNPAFGERDEGVYFSYSYGDVDIFMLDDRYFRDQETGPIAYGDPQGRRSMLGPTQTTWLLDGLAASRATFKLIVNGSVWTAEGGDDSWAVLLPARDAIFDAIRDRGVEGVVLLSGDQHHSEIRMISRTASAAYDLPELVSSPLARSTTACPRPTPELLACYAGNRMMAIQLHIDTTLADPMITATIYGHTLATGAFSTLGTFTVVRSQLEL